MSTRTSICLLVTLWGIIFVTTVASIEPATITAYFDAALNSRLPKSKDVGIGPKECALGSSYWCQDVLSARQCGAVKHCIDVVWQYETQSPDNGDICQTCKDMVRQARDELQSNETEELIREVLEGTCRIYFPIKELANECIKLVDEFIPEYIDMLASRMDPQTVCKTAWLCNSNKFKEIIGDLKYLKRPILTADACQDCKQFVNDAISRAKVMSINDFEQKLMNSCDLLQGYLKEACRMAVSSNINDIYIYVTTKMDASEFCALAAMCIDGLPPSVKQLPPVNGVYFRKNTSLNPECDFCEQIITRLKEQLLTNASKEEVLNVLKSLCSHCPEKKKCSDVMDKYFDEIYTFLTEELDPEEVCSALGLCTARVKLVSSSHKKAHFTGDDERNSITWNPKNDAVKIDDFGTAGVFVKTKFPATKPNLKIGEKSNKCNSDMSCVLCEYVIEKLQGILNDNSSEEEIKEAIERVCSLMPKSLSDQCTAFVDEYGSAVMIMLSQELDPSEICTELQLCSSTQSRLTPIGDPPVNTMARIIKTDVVSQQLPIDRMFPFPINNPKSSETCLYCQYAMMMLHTLLNANGTKESILKELDSMCHEMPSKWTDRCDQVLDQYADVVLTMLQSENLSELCNIMSFCKGQIASNMRSTATAAARQAVLDANADGCEVCERTVEILNTLLNNPDVERGISEALKESCNYVPDSMKIKCKQIIEVYGPYLVKLIGELTDSKAVCQSIEICPQPPGQVKLIGGEKCTFGPAYWCKTKIHAKACNALEHCKTHVWKN